jgi:phenylacetic acid degradation operon negative regulatory protein
VWQETLVRGLVSVGYTEQAARQALSRSVREGWLLTERQGRRARISLSERTATLLRTGAERIYSFGEPWQWDGRWLVLILRVPEQRREVRHQLRTSLAWAGLGSLGGGVWLTPHVERETELAAVIADEPAAEATSFVASLGMMGSPAGMAAAAWDLDTVREHYDAFIEDFEQIRPSSGVACFRMQTLLVHAWRKFPFLDPDLPAELLPDGWPRRHAHELFASRRERWLGSARAYFAELESALPLRAVAAA